MQEMVWVYYTYFLISYFQKPFFELGTNEETGFERD